MPAASPSSGNPPLPRKRKPKASADERPLEPPAPAPSASNAHGGTAPSGHRKRPPPASEEDSASASDDDLSSDSGAHRPARTHQPAASTSDNHAVPHKRKPKDSFVNDSSDDDHGPAQLRTPTKPVACAGVARSATHAGYDCGSDSDSDADFDVLQPPKKSRAPANKSHARSGSMLRHYDVISVDSTSDEEEEEAQEEDFRDDLRRQPRSRQAVLRNAAAPGDLDGFAFVEDDHLAQFYVGIDPKLIYVKVEYKDREEASATYKLVWDKCNCCWCVRYLYMHSSRASLFAGGFWVSDPRYCLIARPPPCPSLCRQGNFAVLVGQGHHRSQRCERALRPC